MDHNYKTPVSYQSITKCETLIRRPADGSTANAQARQMAAAHLFAAAEQFEAFAQLKPDSNVALYLNDKALELRITACMA